MVVIGAALLLRLELVSGIVDVDRDEDAGELVPRLELVSGAAEVVIDEDITKLVLR